MLFEALVKNPRIKPEKSFELKRIIAIVYNLSCLGLKSNLKPITTEEEIQIRRIQRICSTKTSTYLYFYFVVRGLVFTITAEVKIIGNITHTDCRLAIVDGEYSSLEGASKHKKSGLI